MLVKIRIDKSLNLYKTTIVKINFKEITLEVKKSF